MRFRIKSSYEHETPINGSTTSHDRSSARRHARIRPRETHQESHHRRSPDLVSGLRRLRRSRLLLQSPRETPARHEKIVTLAGIGCSSRFPYFVNGYGAHFIHGRAVPLASGISLARPDLHVFLFGGDGDGFSIGGNHLDHGARKNINMTYVIMDNFVYGLTKKQTSPTSPIGFKSKTDPTGAIDQPVNPMKKLVASGATFVARTHATQVNHMIQMIERAMDHQGFSVIECLSECVEFFPGAFDPANPRKGGTFELIEEKKWDNTPEDETAPRRHRRARRL